MIRLSLGYVMKMIRKEAEKNLTKVYASTEQRFFFLNFCTTSSTLLRQLKSFLFHFFLIPIHYIGFLLVCIFIPTGIAKFCILCSLPIHTVDLENVNTFFFQSIISIIYVYTYSNHCVFHNLNVDEKNEVRFFCRFLGIDN